MVEVVPRMIVGIASSRDGAIVYLAEVADMDAMDFEAQDNAALSVWVRHERGAGFEIFPIVLRRDTKSGDMEAMVTHYQRLGYKLFNSPISMPRLRRQIGKKAAHVDAYQRKTKHPCQDIE